MKLYKLIKSKSVIIISIMIASSLSLFSQNKYLSFENGIDENYSQTKLPERIVRENGFESVEVEYLFIDAAVSEISINDKIYNFIHIEGFGKMTEIGRPALPCYNDIFAVPDFSVLKISIIQADYKEYSGFLIHPALQPASDLDGAPSPEFELDYVTYETNEFFPSNLVETIESQKWRGTELNFVQIRPVQFNPVTKTIRVYSKIKYKVEFIGGSNSFSFVSERSTENFIKRALRIPLNSEMVTQASKSLSNKKDKIQHTNGPRKDYIIITTPAYQEAAELLAKWKMQLGYSVEMNLKDNWNSIEVKDSLRAYYNNWTPHPDYFVIIGDHPVVPGEMKTSYEYGDWATDLYYGCMDDETDWTPDISRGRISVSSPVQALQVINKIISYEKTPPVSENYYNTGVNCGYFQDYDNYNSYEDRRFLLTCEDVRNYLMEQNYNIIRVYNTDNNVTPQYWNNTLYSNGEAIPTELLRSSGFAWNGDAYDIASQINQGRFYVLHRDHGSYNGWADPSFYISNINSLTNADFPTIVFSMNCQTGGFYQDICFSEAFLRHNNGGAAGILGASQVSYSGYNDAIACGLFDAIWPYPGLNPVFGSGGVNNPPENPHSPIYQLADVMDYGLVRMLQTWAGSTSLNKYQFELFHWFGDPTTKIWTDNPQIINADFPATLPVGSTSLIISNCNSYNATATVVYNGELKAKINLNEGEGTIVFPEPICFLPVTLTISQTNYKPLVYVFNPTATTLLLPTNQSNNNTIIPLFDWDDVPNATSYHIQISNESDFANIIHQNSDLSNSQLQIPNNILNFNTQYFWRIRSQISGNYTDWSCVLSFRTMKNAPILSEPANESVDIPLNANFVWNSFVGADSYSFQLSTDIDFSTLIQNENGITNTNFSFPMGILEYEQLYYWRVNANINSQSTEWSDVWSFTTIGRVFTINIGTGNYSNAFNTYPAPYGNFYWGAKHQILIKADELTNLGFTGGNIYSLAFDVENTNSSEELDDFYIKMKHTTTNSLNGFDNYGSWTQVTSPASHLPYVGWNTHLFSTPFIWNGSSNILIEVCFQNDVFNSNASTRYTTTSNTSVAYRRRDGTGVCELTSVTSTSSSRPNVQFSVEIPLLAVPVLVQPVNNSIIAEPEVNLDWNPVVSATKYVLQVSTDQEFTNLIINNPNLNITQFPFNSQYGQDYYWRVRAVGENRISDWSQAWYFQTSAYQTHEINLHYGWNYFSSYIEPQNLDIEDLFEDFDEDITIIKNSFGGVYIPAYNINTLVNWNILNGYLGHVTNESTLSVYGLLVNPEQTPIELNAGWSLISYLRTEPLNSYIALNTILDNLIICKNGYGGVFIPSYQINTLGDLIPGSAYYIAVTNDDVLIYPANSSQKNNYSEITHNEPILKPDFSNTGNDATLIITIKNAEDGTNIAVFNSENKIVGTAEMKNGVAAVTIWGDNEATTIPDGACENEMLYVKIFNPDNNEFKDIQIISINELSSQNQNPFYYKRNALYIAEANIVSYEETSLNVYPNPINDVAQISYFLENETSINISILNSMGCEVLNLVNNENKSMGNHLIQFSALDLLNGVYFCNLKTESKVLTTRFIILK